MSEEESLARAVLADADYPSPVPLSGGAAAGPLAAGVGSAVAETSFPPARLARPPGAMVPVPFSTVDFGEPGFLAVDLEGGAGGGALAVQLRPGGDVGAGGDTSV